MTVQHFVLTPDQHRPALNLLGTQVKVLASNAAMQSFGITLQQGDEGTGPPPHSHDLDDAFSVLKGEIQLPLQRRVACLQGRHCDPEPTPNPTARAAAAKQ